MRLQFAVGDPTSPCSLFNNGEFGVSVGLVWSTLFEVNLCLVMRAGGPKHSEELCHGRGPYS